MSYKNSLNKYGKKIQYLQKKYSKHVKGEKRVKKINIIIKKQQNNPKKEKTKVCDECRGTLVDSHGFMVCEDCGLSHQQVYYGTSQMPVETKNDEGYIKKEHREPMTHHRLRFIKQLGEIKGEDYLKKLKYKIRNFNQLESYLQDLNLSETQSLMIKDFVMKLNPPSYKITIILAAKHILKFKMLPTKKELIEAIKSQRFKRQIIEEIENI